MKTNPRLLYGERYGEFHDIVSGAVFPFTPGDPKSREAALEALDKHGTATIEALDKFTGKTLSREQLLRGVDHFDDRSEFQRQKDKADDEAALRPPAPPQTDNPYLKALAMREQQRKLTPEEALQKQAADWDAKKAATEARAAFDAEPRRVKAVQHAREAFRAIRYDTGATARDVEMAEFRLKLAQEGDLNLYREKSREADEKRALRVEIRAGEVNERIKALHAEKSAILNSAFEPPLIPTTQPSAVRDPYFQPERS